jgi:pimeloyl-ACP methyl ester carboxylesterase
LSTPLINKANTIWYIKLEMAKKRRFKKRYYPLVLFLMLLGLSHSGIFSLFKKDEEIKAEFEEEGFPSPIFDFIQHENNPNNETHCIITSNDDAKALVIFLHGSPGSGSNCTNYLKDEKLNQYAQIATMDRAGYGYSDFGDTEPSLAKQVNYIEAIIDKYGKDKKIILVGHSLGGPIIARAAMDIPKKIDGLVMVAASNSPELEPEEWFRPILNWQLIRWIIPTPFRVSNQEILPLKRQLEKMLPLWSNIRIPVVVIQGDEDNLVPKGNADFTEKMLSHNSNVKIDILEGRNHFILWSEQARITNHIIDIIKM